MKKCTGCGIEKEHTPELFYRDKGFKSGLKSRCKECNKKAQKYRAEHPKQKGEKLPPGMKKCKGCGKIKKHNEEFFHRDRKTRAGFKGRCKDCIAKITKEYRSRPETIARLKLYYARPDVIEMYKKHRDDPDRRKAEKEANKEWYNKQKNKELVKKRNKERYADSKKKKEIQKKTKIYMSKPENKLRRNEREVEKRKNNPVLRIKHNLKCNFSKQLKKIGTKKPKGTMHYIGCSKEELLHHLNVGTHKIIDYLENTNKKTLFNCDHIIPSAYFLDKLELDAEGKITKETEPWLYKWWNYRNLRIWPATDNNSKNDKMDYELIKQHGIEDLLKI